MGKIALIDSPYLLLKMEPFFAFMRRRSLSRTMTLANRFSVDVTSISDIACTATVMKI